MTTDTTHTSGNTHGPTLSTHFPTFSRAVHARYAELAKRELYITNVGDELFERYMLAYPAGTNPIFRKRAVYDCAACKQFIRRLGKLVGIRDNRIVTVWGDLDLPQPFKGVADALDTAVRASKIQGVFRSKERKYGEEYNYDPETSDRFDHFWGEVSDHHHTADPGAQSGEKMAIYQVLNRGLLEIRESDLVMVLDLIGANDLYRGEEFRPAVEGFLELMRQFKAAGNADELFVWANLDNKFAKFRNTAIGSLLIDLSEGKELENAVRAYEAKVAPENYKRTSSPITTTMVEQAVKTLTDLGLSEAIHRRYARFSDINVNDVLFVDNDTRGQMKNSVVALLEGSVKQTPPNLNHAIPIAADEFVATILPKAKSLEVFVENRHQGNFVSLTGADGPERLFKWPNNFAWSYKGELADSELRKQVQSRGGRVDGVLRFSHRWNYDKRNTSLMDLHVFMPGSGTHVDGCHDTYPGQCHRVGWNRRTDPASGGVQDVDYTEAAPRGYVPVENITFPSLDRLPNGEYTFKIHNWSLRQPTEGGFQAEIECGGQVYQYEMTRPLKSKEWVTVATATLKDGRFTVNHKLETSSISRDVWGVKTEALVPVASVMHSPNHWGDNKVGPKHLILALRGCKNPDSTRGIYNEFLRSDLEKHRKVFEVLGSKTKCAYSDDQVSGVGFTAARGDTVTVVVDGKRPYTLTF